MIGNVNFLYNYNEENMLTEFNQFIQKLNIIFRTTLYIYIYIYVCVCVCVCVRIYMYISTMVYISTLSFII